MVICTIQHLSKYSKRIISAYISTEPIANFIMKLLLQDRARAVGRSENPGGGASSNVVGIICPPELPKWIWLGPEGYDIPSI